MHVIKYVDKANDTRAERLALQDLKSRDLLPGAVALARHVLAPLRERLGDREVIIRDLLTRLISEELRYARTLESPAGVLVAFYQNLDMELAEFQDFVRGLLEHVVAVLPHADGKPCVLAVEVPLVTVLRSGEKLVHEVVKACVARHFDGEEFHLGAKLGERVGKALARVSGMTVEQAGQRPNRLKWPDQVGKPVDEVVDLYLGDTALKDLLLLPVPLRLTDDVRSEHMLMTAGSGHGKTQSLQYLISRDLDRPRGQEVGMVVIDSQGDFLNTIARLRNFEGNDRLLMVDASDFDYPVALNMFDLGGADLNTLRPADRERALTATVQLFEYVIGALFGSDLTSKQSTVFRYLIRLMMSIPGANIQTLSDCLENPGEFTHYMERMRGPTKTFFLQEFGDRQFNDTRKQISRRLYGVLENDTFARMFSARENRLNISRALDDGRVVLVNTSREALGDACSVMGRFVIAMTLKAAFDRSSKPIASRRTSYLYIDEARDCFDTNINNLLEQVRKYRLGVILAHQDLNQMSDGLRASVMSNTALKLAGGVSGRDSRYLEDDLRASRDFILAQYKGDHGTRFATFVRNVTPRAVSWSIPFGVMERMPKMSDRAFEAMIARNREELSERAGAEEDVVVSEVVAQPARENREEEPARPPIPDDDPFENADFGDFSEPF